MKNIDWATVAVWTIGIAFSLGFWKLIYHVIIEGVHHVAR